MSRKDPRRPYRITSDVCQNVIRSSNEELPSTSEEFCFLREIRAEFPPT